MQDNLITRLRDRISIDGKLIRGSLTRVAEFVGSHPPDVRRWLDGSFRPHSSVIPRIEKLLKSKIFDPKAKKTGPNWKKLRAASR